MRPARLTRRVLLASAVGLLVAAAGGSQAAYLAAEPGGDKECPSILAPPSGAPLLSAPTSDTRLRWKQRGGRIDDASCLDGTHVYGVVDVRSEEDVRAALAYARANGLKVSAAGARHSMGGQAFFHNALVLDMTGYRAVSLDPTAKVIAVESGATWHQIQARIHPRFAVKAMQSTDLFTVGGSIAVNAHGMDHRFGAIAGTIRQMRVMLADGSVRTVSRAADPELFRLVVGGYGLFGIVLDAQIDVTENVLYHSERRIVSYRDLPRLFAEELAPDPDVQLLYAHLSTAPESFLDEGVLYLYRHVGPAPADLPPLEGVGQVKLRRLIFNASKLGGPAMSAKWLAEKELEPRVESCTVTRQEGLTAGCYVSRNEPMHDSVPYLQNSLKRETDILQEYFVPRERFVPYVDALRDVLRHHRANLLNASIRVVHREDVALSYAPVDAFAVVLYLNQSADEAGTAAMRRLTGELIDLASQHGGRFFLPYQLHYSPAQLARAYPEVAEVFRAKRRYDPDLLFTNTFWETYAPSFPS